MTFEDRLDRAIAGLDASDAALVRELLERAEVRAAAQEFLDVVVSSAATVGREILLPTLEVVARSIVSSAVHELGDELKG